MRHWLLRATPLLAAVLGIWTSLSFATATIRNRVDPVNRIDFQRQQSRPQALSLSLAYRRSSRSVIPSAIGKRDGIHIQDLDSSYLLHYHVFTVGIPERSL